MTNRKQFVEHNKIQSDITLTETGIPQGSALSGMLFTIFLNDMPNVCVFSEPYQYADDTNIIDSEHPESRDELLKRMQSDIQNLIMWLKSNYLELNNSKTQMMVICSPKNQIYAKDFKINVENVTISCVNVIKCLGLYIDSQLNWNHHIINVVKKCNFMLSSLYPYMNLLTPKQ